MIDIVSWTTWYGFVSPSYGYQPNKHSVVVSGMVLLYFKFLRDSSCIVSSDPPIIVPQKTEEPFVLHFHIVSIHFIFDSCELSKTSVGFLREQHWGRCRAHLQVLQHLHHCLLLHLHLQCLELRLSLNSNML